MALVVETNRTLNSKADTEFCSGRDVDCSVPHTHTPGMADNLGLTLTPTSDMTLTHDITLASLTLTSDMCPGSGMTLTSDVTPNFDKLTAASDLTLNSDTTSTLGLPSAETWTVSGEVGMGSPRLEVGGEREGRRVDRHSGIRMRSDRFEVIREEEEEEDVCHSLQPVSKPVPVHLCGRGAGALFVVVVGEEPIMSTIRTSQKCQAIFQRCRFWHEELQCEVTTFLHAASRRYLAVEPHKDLLTLVPSHHHTPGPVVNLHGSSPSSHIHTSQPNQACLFVVLEKGHACLQPAGCESKSVDYDQLDGQLKVVKGRRWVFEILPAGQACGIIGHSVLRKLLKKYMTVVIVISYLK